jgi:hypothetical protein
MAKIKGDTKTFNMVMPKDMWMFLKLHALEQEESMTDIVTRCVANYMKKIEKKNNNQE